MEDEKIFFMVLEFEIISHSGNAQITYIHTQFATITLQSGLRGTSLQAYLPTN